MPSSTSSSSTAEPQGPWLRIWVVALLFTLVVLGGLEIFWRYRGHTPAIDLDLGLWAYHREKLRHAGPHAIALLGASRMQFGFVPEAFLEEHPEYTIVQLAVGGHGPFATLRDLAHDDSFGGLVICSIVERVLQPSRLEDQRVFVEYYQREWGPGKKISRLLGAALEENLVIRRADLRGWQLLRVLAAGKLPRVDYIQAHFDRRRVADYSLVDVEEVIESRLTRRRKQLIEDPPPSMEAWRVVVAGLAEFVKKIESRGGRVVFVRFPERGRYDALSDEHFPRAKYWDTLAASVGTDAIHHDDMPGVADLWCPDESHLDYPDAIVFTKTLARELSARGVID